MAKEGDLSGQNEERKGEIVPSVATPSVGKGLELFAQKDAIALTSTKEGRAATVGMLRDVFLVGSPLGKADPITGKRGLDFFMGACVSTGIGINDPSVRETLIDFGVDVLAESSGPESEYNLDSEKLAYLKEIFLNSGEDPDVTGERFAEEGSKRLSQIGEGLVQYQAGSLKSKSHAIIFRGVKVLSQDYIPGVYRPLTALEIFNSVDKLPSSDDVLGSAETAFGLMETEKNEELAKTFANIALSFAVHLFEHAEDYAQDSGQQGSEIQARAITIVRHFVDGYIRTGDRAKAKKYASIIGEEIPEEKLIIQNEIQVSVDKILEPPNDAFYTGSIFNSLFEQVQSPGSGAEPDLYVLRPQIPIDEMPRIVKHFRDTGESVLCNPFQFSHRHLAPYMLKGAFAALAVAKELERNEWPIRRPFQYRDEEKSRTEIDMPDLNPDLARSLVDQGLLASAAKDLLQADPGNEGGREADKLVDNIHEAAFLYSAAGLTPPVDMVTITMQRLRRAITEPNHDLDTAWGREAYEKFRLRATLALNALTTLWSASVQQSLESESLHELDNPAKELQEGE